MIRKRFYVNTKILQIYHFMITNLKLQTIKLQNWYQLYNYTHTFSNLATVKLYLQPRKKPKPINGKLSTRFLVRSRGPRGSLVRDLKFGKRILRITYVAATRQVCLGIINFKISETKIRLIHAAYLYIVSTKRGIENLISPQASVVKVGRVRGSGTQNLYIGPRMYINILTCTRNIDVHTNCRYIRIHALHRNRVR